MGSELPEGQIEQKSADLATNATTSLSLSDFSSFVQRENREREERKTGIKRSGVTRELGTVELVEETAKMVGHKIADTLGL